MEKEIFILISVKIETDLEINKAIDEFSSETNYSFTDTEHVKVINTEMIEGS